MGKSIRSKSVLRAKSIKRKGEFTKFVDERAKRISEKLSNETKDEKKPIVKPVDEKKVSTSGWRNSRKSIYKQNLKKKSKSHMKF